METFVAILGASELTYVEASATQQGDDWIRSNERALRYCGGGTQVIVPDNLRSAVSRSDPYEPGINATFDAFAQHYGVVIMPARVRQARDKALVENAVRLTYQRIYAPLRDRTFHSLDELNAAIGPLLEQHNGRRFQRLPYSRRELFEQIERHTLAPLPAYHFPLQQTREVTVQFNYHVELREDRHHYSVPWQLRTRDPRTKVKLLYDERTVSIYYDNVRLAEYRRDRRPGGYTTLPDHMPPQHRWYAEWSPERFVRWGRALGRRRPAWRPARRDDHELPPRARAVGHRVRVRCKRGRATPDLGTRRFCRMRTGTDRPRQRTPGRPWSPSARSCRAYPAAPVARRRAATSARAPRGCPRRTAPSTQSRPRAGRSPPGERTAA